MQPVSPGLAQERDVLEAAARLLTPGRRSSPPPMSRAEIMRERTSDTVSTSVFIIAASIIEPCEWPMITNFLPRLKWAM